MITHKQLLRHKFLLATATDEAPLYMHGVVNGVLANGVFHFPLVGKWVQCKNISHLKHEYFKATGEKLTSMSENEWFIINGLVN